MHFKAFSDKWLGVSLVIIVCASSLWLAATNQLTLYVHPRYLFFTSFMSGVGLVVCFFFICRYRKNGESKIEGKSPGRSVTRKVITISTFGLAFFCMLVTRPATLTSTTFQQRSINSSVAASAKPSSVVPLFGSENYNSFSVKDWASLLTQTKDISFYEKKSATLVGFISPDTDDPQNTFFVSRFVITCCAVDASPIGVPVYAPNWRSLYHPDQWVEVKGNFIENPAEKSDQQLVVKPTNITQVAQPKDPYVH